MGVMYLTAENITDVNNKKIWCDAPCVVPDMV